MTTPLLCRFGFHKGKWRPKRETTPKYDIVLVPPYSYAYRQDIMRHGTCLRCGVELTEHVSTVHTRGNDSYGYRLVERMVDQMDEGDAS